MIPRVVASEIGAAQTSLKDWGSRTTTKEMEDSRMRLKAQSKKVQTLQAKSEVDKWDPEYVGARGTLTEATGTIR